MAPTLSRGVDREAGVAFRGGATAMSAVLLAVSALGACGGEEVAAFGRAGGSGGTASAAGGMATAAGGLVIISGTIPSAGGSAMSSGPAASSTGGTAAPGSSDAGSDVDHDSGTSAPDASAPRPPATGLTLPNTVDEPGVAPWFKVYRPTDLAAAVKATGHALPIIVWANGGCLRTASVWEPLYQRWAAGGFVVIALDVGRDGNTFAATTVDDQTALIDWAIAEAGKPGGAYAGKLDTGRIVAAGNSCGAVTALGIAAKDNRVNSVFVLSGSSSLAGSDPSIMQAISVPVGYIVGGVEDIAAYSAVADYNVLSNGVPGMVVSRATGDHVLVSTDATVLAQEAEIALNWMDLCLYGTPEAFAALSSATVCASCDPGVWQLKAKNLATLPK